MSKQVESNFIVEVRLSIVSDKDGDFYLNPSSENVERLIRDSLIHYTNTGDMIIKKIQVIPSQPL